MSDEGGERQQLEEENSEGSNEDDDFRIIDDVLQYPYPCRICGALVSEEEADEGLGYQLCNRCWPDAPASMAHHTHNDYDIDDQGIIWSSWPDAPEPYTDLQSMPTWRHHPDLEHYRRFPLSKLRQQLSISRSGGTYTCFVCDQEHTHEAPRPAWLLDAPVLQIAPAAVGRQGADAAAHGQERRR